MKQRKVNETNREEIWNRIEREERRQQREEREEKIKRLRSNK